MEVTLPIIRELIAVGDGLMWIVGPGEMVSENTSRGIEEPDVSGSTITIKADNWHFHLNQDNVGGIQFVETYGDLASHYIRFSDLTGETLLRAYVPRPQPDPANEAPSKSNPTFDSMRERYGGAEGVEHVRREVRSEFSGASARDDT